MRRNFMVESPNECGRLVRMIYDRIVRAGMLMECFYPPINSIYPRPALATRHAYSPRPPGCLSRLCSRSVARYLALAHMPLWAGDKKPDPFLSRVLARDNALLATLAAVYRPRDAFSPARSTSFGAFFAGRRLSITFAISGSARRAACC